MLDISKLIIIDFEGFIGKPPNLVGVYHHDLGYPIYQNFGKHQTTQRINHVRNQLIHRIQDFQALTTTAEGKWTKVIKYNKQYDISLFWALETANLIK